MPPQLNSTDKYGANSNGKNSSQPATRSVGSNDHDRSRANLPTNENHLPSKLSYALAYARHGMLVFPVHCIEADGECSCRKLQCSSAGKHPRLNQWQDLATVAESQIRAWWQQYPDANIGVKCGVNSNLTVLDVDGDEGRAALRELELENGELPETPIAVTGSGGAHYYFAYEPELQNAVRFAPGLDVRTEGGLVVGVGSKTKRTYEWEAFWTLGDNLLPAKMPKWLSELIRNVNASATNSSGLMLPPQISSGQRNNWLYKLARSLKARGMTAAAITAALQAENAAKCLPPLENAEVVQIAQHAATEPDQPGFQPSVVGNGRVGTPSPEPERPRLLTFAESKRLADEADARPHIVQDLLTAQDIFGLAAKKGVGKSTLLRTLAVAVSEGSEFLGLRTNQTRVWYLDLEPGNQQKRHEKFELLGWNENSENLIITASPPVAGQPWAFEWLEEHIVKEGFGLVIIDTLFKFCKIEQGNDYSSGLYGPRPSKVS